MKAVLLGGQNSPNKNCVACDFNVADFQHGSFQGRQNRNGTTRWSKLSQAGEPAPRDSPGTAPGGRLRHLCSRLGWVHIPVGRSWRARESLQDNGRKWVCSYQIEKENQGKKCKECERLAGAEKVWAWLWAVRGLWCEARIPDGEERRNVNQDPRGRAE